MSCNVPKFRGCKSSARDLTPSLIHSQVLRLEALEEDDQAAQILLIAERDAAIADAAEARAEAKAHMLEAVAARTDAAAAHEVAAEAAQEATVAAGKRRAARAEASTAGRQAAASNAEPWGHRAPALAYEVSHLQNPRSCLVHRKVAPTTTCKFLLRSLWYFHGVTRSSYAWA